MLIKQIYDDMIAARKGNDAVAKSLMVTLYSEAAMVGKNRRNGDTTDEEAIGMVKKFAANTEETIRLLAERGQDAAVQQRELAILQAYLPRQLTQDELASAISAIVEAQSEKSPKIMGKVMAELKARYGATYDGKMASDLVKSALA
jgi:uncharacterized protein YqeY